MELSTIREQAIYDLWKTRQWSKLKLKQLFGLDINDGDVHMAIEKATRKRAK